MKKNDLAQVVEKKIHKRRPQNSLPRPCFAKADVATRASGACCALAAICALLSPRVLPCVWLRALSLARCFPFAFEPRLHADLPEKNPPQTKTSCASATAPRTRTYTHSLTPSSLCPHPGKDKRVLSEGEKMEAGRWPLKTPREARRGGAKGGEKKVRWEEKPRPNEEGRGRGSTLSTFFSLP